MSKVSSIRVHVASACLVSLGATGVVLAQQASPATAASTGATNQKSEQLQEVIVTGSRIAESEAQREQPLSVISTAAMQKTGLADVGTLLQQITTGGSALNTKFNSSGNFGYPPDGGGIAAGASEVDLRNLDPKRTLVLVDGLRWVNESSASGVSGSADLNTIPMSVIDHIEVLEDGASAIYGSDAIAGVVNIITKKRFDGVQVEGYTGEYSKGGRNTEGSLTVGGSSGRFSGMFVATYFKQDAISSSKWWQSAFPEPLAGIGAGSSGTPQGRDLFCDPAVTAPNYGSCTADQSEFYDVTLNTGTTNPVFDPNNPVGGTSTYHNFSGADRFNYAVYNLLLTPQDRKSLFSNFTYSVNDNLDVYAKGLYNTRESVNQAAPEPIFVGPVAGTGGLADRISISALNPYNPFGIDLDANSNLGFVTRRPIEGGPRVFTQNVDTWYFGTGLKGHFGGASSSDYRWDVNFVDSVNKASQVFTGGYNLANLQLALGDPAVCAQVPNCVPLDLFGGQGRPITRQMLNFVEVTQHDESEQDLKIFSANITGHPFSIVDRPVGIAVGAEHRQYVGIFNPDPLRQNGLSQDSPAQRVFGGYHVNEAYAEFSVPVLETLGASAAARYSDYSDFGSTTTFKGGLRWQPTRDFGLRGDYSTGFRAPDLGELFGLTNFGATLVDPCGPTGSPVVLPGVNTPLAQACRAQGVPNGFTQANTQITTFTGGNAHLHPEKSKSFSAGIVYDASWAENMPATNRLTVESTYYHHKITGAIQAADLQSLLNACVNAGGTNPTLCSGFSRGPSGNLNPPSNFLENIGEITTDGEDLKINWGSSPLPFGNLSASVTVTRVNGYKAVDNFGNVAQRQVGVEVSNTAIPRYRMIDQIGWSMADYQLTWTIRYLSAVTEACGNALTTGVPGCETSSTIHTMHAVTYNDVNFAYFDAFRLHGLTIQAGVNNLFGVNPPICFTCTLNGYDAGTYDLPGAFWNVRASYKF